MRILFLDCLSGISGDMAVGALCDLGADPELIEAGLAKLGVSDEYHLHIGRQQRQNIEGVKFDVHVSGPSAETSATGGHGHSHGPHDHHSHDHHSHDHHHDHDSDDHHHDHDSSHDHTHGRSFRQIQEMIGASSLSPFVKERAVATFRRVAVAEGKIHGQPPDDVTFHEVGAIDSIVDIVAFCIGLEALAVERVLVSCLFEGTGFIRCAHGQYPLPAPATLEILAGIPLRQIDEPLEFITPTGAAILAEFGTQFGPMPELTVERIGYGLGTRDTQPRPNVLRAVIGTLTGPASDAESDTVTEITTNLDDITPELTAAAAASLLAAGALDVFLTPVQMKKGRPGVMVTVLCEPDRANEFAEAILRETTAFGVRIHETRRRKLRRETTSVETSFGQIAVKLGWLGGECIQATPEFESCREAANRAVVPVILVYREASAAAKIQKRSAAKD